MVRINYLFAESVRVISETYAREQATIGRMAHAVIRKVEAGGKLLVCGNGGSCADAEHLVAELLVRLKPDTNRAPIPAIALTMDMATLTACANDYGYEEHYARMVRALGTSGDVLLAISTSGDSMNIIRAVNEAKSMGIYTIGLLGSGGGKVEPDISLAVPSDVTGRIQEAHGVVIHALAELVEEGLCLP